MPSSTDSGNPVYSIASIVFLVLFVGSLAVRFWADHIAAQFTGPMHITADDSQVLLSASDALYQLTPTGELVKVVSFNQAGLPGYPIDLRMTAEGDLLFASQRPAQVFICNTQAWTCHRSSFSPGPKPERQFKVLMNSGGFSWLFTDARGDTLQGQKPGDTTAAPLLPEHTLAGPNDLVFDNEGHLWIADTDHRRVVEFVLGADGVWQEENSLSAINEFTLEENFYPMMLALAADGNLWLTQGSEFSEGKSDLMIYHREEGALARLDLPASKFATDLVALQNDILVSDLDAYRVYRVDTRTRAVEVFGDPAFQSAMMELQESRSWYSRTSSMAMILVLVFGALMILFAIRATPKNRRWTAVPVPADFVHSASETPQVKGVHWLKRSKGFERAVTWMPRLTTAAGVLMLFMMAVIYFLVQSFLNTDAGIEAVDIRTRLDLIFLLGGVIVVLSLPAVLHQARAWKIQLGSDGKRLHLRLQDGQELIAQNEDIARTQFAILYRQHTVPIQYGRRKPCYQEGELESWVAPLLGEVKQMSPLEGLKYQWKHRNPQLILNSLSLLGGAVIMAFMLYLLP